jgi:hypothetical protein
MAIVLNLKEKMGYFRKHWSVDLQEAVVICAEMVWANSPLPILELIHFSLKSSGYH